MSDHIQITGVFWMERADWDALLPISPTAPISPRHTKSGVASPSMRWRRSRAARPKVLKIRAEPDEFLRWCRTKNLHIDGKARLEYANQKAAAQWFARRETKH